MEGSDGRLLDGPRGRRLCYRLLSNVLLAEDRGWDWHGLWAPESVPPGTFARDLAEQVQLLDVAHWVGDDDTDALIAALSSAVDDAMYWQPPDREDRMLAHSEVAAVLRPVAEFVRAAPSVDWWWTPMDEASQAYCERLRRRSDGLLRGLVRFLRGEVDDEPASEADEAFSMPEFRQAMAEWRRTEMESQAQARRLGRPGELPGGTWWSSPNHLMATTRDLEDFGAVGLFAVEDSGDEEKARCWPVAPTARPTIYEVDGPEAWASLTSQFPFEVSNSRSRDWYFVTDVVSRWYIPDWQQVAERYDGVHVSVGAYLATAGRALPVLDGHTLLAGWSPDETYWMTDELTQRGPATLWHIDRGYPTWKRPRRVVPGT